MKIYLSVSRIMAGILIGFLISPAHAGTPLWTMTPAPGTQTTQTVQENSTATIQYIVQNQSTRSKSLVMQPMAGLTQTTPCVLSPKGQSGYSCIFTITVTGSALPASGIHNGPVLCQANPDGTPNPNQCYQPAQIYSLNISRGSAPSQATISISAPVQQNRVVTVSGLTPLSLVITNDVSSPSNANAVTVSDKSACPTLAVDDSDCISLAPGSSCNLLLSSADPYVPCTITISGSNTTNSPTTPIAFSYLNGLVFDKTGVNGKVVIDVSNEFSSQWTSANANIGGATSLDDGSSNTDAIILDSSCSSDMANCAAQQCRNIGAPWYLPAINELLLINTIFCPGGTSCNFGEFSSVTRYWSSTQSFGSYASSLSFPSGFGSADAKGSTYLVRCIRNY